MDNTDNADRSMQWRISVFLLMGVYPRKEEAYFFDSGKEASAAMTSAAGSGLLSECDYIELVDPGGRLFQRWGSSQTLADVSLFLADTGQESLHCAVRRYLKIEPNPQ